MTFRTEEQDRITRRGLAAARAALAAAGKPGSASPTQSQSNEPTERRNTP